MAIHSVENKSDSRFSIQNTNTLGTQLNVTKRRILSCLHSSKGYAILNEGQVRCCINFSLADLHKELLHSESHYEIIIVPTLGNDSEVANSYTLTINNH